MNIQTFQVVVGYDFSKSGREAMFRALALASRAPSHVLHFVNVLEDGDYRAAEVAQKAVAEVIERGLREITAPDNVHFFVHARIGKPADEILAVARDVGADLIILGTKGLTGVEHFFLGSVAERIVREAHCTVEVARAKTYDDVRLLEMMTVEPKDPHHHYIKPHRYSYESSQVQMRPHDWPLY